MADTKKVKMINPRGNPTDRDKDGNGVILARGATVTLPEYLADSFINAGDAEEVADKSDKKKKSDE